jgi:hypothetical protein
MSKVYILQDVRLLKLWYRAVTVLGFCPHYVVACIQATVMNSPSIRQNKQKCLESGRVFM